MGVFDRYAPFVQDFIYAHEWENLRGVQVAAGEAIFDTDDHVLLCASTASGKTEAAFFPILTEFWENPPASVGALYIGPLKALINDQFVRLNDLCEEAEIPVWHWHGDVAASHKRRLLKHPSGILQITPESLEALLLHKHMAVPRLFCDLRFVVIDEVHSLLRGDRGGQTLCLIERLSRMAGVNPRRTLRERAPALAKEGAAARERRTFASIGVTSAIQERLLLGGNLADHRLDRVLGPEDAVDHLDEAVAHGLPVFPGEGDGLAHAAHLLQVDAQLGILLGVLIQGAALFHQGRPQRQVADLGGDDGVAALVHDERDGAHTGAADTDEMGALERGRRRSGRILSHVSLSFEMATLCSSP